MAYGISNAVSSNMSNVVADVVVTQLNTDGATGQYEYYWQNTKWSQYWGYFNDPDLGELKSSFLMKGIWVVGKGYTADPETTVILDHITGWGKDTFLDILFNMVVISRLAGDAFAEIIRDKNSGVLLNLKVLDPGSIRIVVDDKGILKRYEQVSKISGKILSFEPDRIWHLANNRLADQIHGLSSIVSMEQTILAEKESFSDTKKFIHRNARPFIIFKLKTDDKAKIDAFVVKMDQAMNADRENVYIPDDENILSYEVVTVNAPSILMQWRDNIRDKFYRCLGLPLSLFGSNQSTESGGKIEYLGHEQIFHYDQQFLEEQVWNQLYLRIKLNSPVTLLENLHRDEGKDAGQGMEVQPNDVTAGSGA